MGDRLAYASCLRSTKQYRREAYTLKPAWIPKSDLAFGGEVKASQIPGKVGILCILYRLHVQGHGYIY